MFVEFFVKNRKQFLLEKNNNILFVVKDLVVVKKVKKDGGSGFERKSVFLRRKRQISEFSFNVIFVIVKK